MADGRKASRVEKFNCTMLHSRFLCAYLLFNLCCFTLFAAKLHWFGQQANILKPITNSFGEKAASKVLFAVNEPHCNPLRYKQISVVDYVTSFVVARKKCLFSFTRAHDFAPQLIRYRLPSLIYSIPSTSHYAAYFRIYGLIRSYGGSGPAAHLQKLPKNCAQCNPLCTHGTQDATQLPAPVEHFETHNVWENKTHSNEMPPFIKYTKQTRKKLSNVPFVDASEFQKILDDAFQNKDDSFYQAWLIEEGTSETVAAIDITAGSKAVGTPKLGDVGTEPFSLAESECKRRLSTNIVEERKVSNTTEHD